MPGAAGPAAALTNPIPDLPDGLPQERIEEAVSTGAEAIVTACPWCEKTFNEAIRESGSSIEGIRHRRTRRESILKRG